MEFAKNLLDKYFETKKTKSATAHSNVHGITVTVRFSHEDLIKYGDGYVAASESDTQETQSFKMISQKQFKRNRQRYGSFKNKQDLDNKHDKVHQTRSKSRSNTIEELRACDISLDNSATLISPEPVKHTVSEADHGGASATSMPCHFTESPHSPDNIASSICVNTSPNVNQLEESASEITMPSVQCELSHTSNEDDLSSVSTSDTCDDLSSIYSGSCDEYDCSYGGGLHMKPAKHPRMCTFSLCNRCPTSKGLMLVCAKCRENGKHKRHKHYLKPPDKDSYNPKWLKECIDGTCPACKDS